MQTLITCKGCSQDKPHHSQGYCRNCYHKFIVRGTGGFDRNDPEVYQKHLSSIKAKISVTQKQRIKNAIISQLTKNELKELYCERKMSMGDIAKTYHCSRTYIMLLLQKYDLPIRNKSAARAEAKRKGKNVGFSVINENFFKGQAPEMAYVLGFIYSDGNLGNQHNQFSISQKEPEILYKIKELMASQHSITRHKNQELYTITIGNKNMVNDLLRAYQLGYFRNSDLIKIFNFFYDDFSRQKELFLRRKYEAFLKCFEYNFDGERLVNIIKKEKSSTSLVTAFKERLKTIKKGNQVGEGAD